MLYIQFFIFKFIDLNSDIFLYRNRYDDVKPVQKKRAISIEDNPIKKKKLNNGIHYY